MTKMNLQARIDRLKLAPMMRDMPAFFNKTFEYIFQMELATTPLALDETLEDRWVTFEAEHGTREKFIEIRMENWKKRYPRKGEEK